MNIKKEKYKENIKKIGNETLDDLEPLVKKSGERLIDFLKEIITDGITIFFNQRKENQNDKKRKK